MRAKCRVADVAVIWWALMDHASQQDERGSIEGFDTEIVAVFFQIEQTAVQAVMQALQDKGCLNGKRIANWDEYQPDEGSAERMRRHRTVTPPSQPVTVTVSDKKTSISSSESQSGSDSEREVEAKFELFYAAYPRKQGPGQARKAFRAAIRKADLETLLAGIERYRKIKPGYADWAMPATWLNGERWNDEAFETGVQRPTPAAPKFGPKEFRPVDRDAIWTPRLKMWTATKTWYDSWGAKPGEPGCEVPKNLLEAA